MTKGKKIDGWNIIGTSLWPLKACWLVPKVLAPRKINAPAPDSERVSAKNELVAGISLSSTKNVNLHFNCQSINSSQSDRCSINIWEFKLLLSSKACDNDFHSKELPYLWLHFKSLCLCEGELGVIWHWFYRKKILRKVTNVNFRLSQTKKSDLWPVRGWCQPRPATSFYFSYQRFLHISKTNGHFPLYWPTLTSSAWKSKQYNLCLQAEL